MQCCGRASHPNVRQNGGLIDISSPALIYSQRTKTFDARGRDPNMIDQHLADATTWARFDTTQSTQAKILRVLCKTYDESKWPYLEGSWSDRNKFPKYIEGSFKNIRERVKRLTRTSQELINLAISKPRLYTWFKS
jgi:hypothetical protein